MPKTKKSLDSILLQLSKESESNYPVDLNARVIQIEDAKADIIGLLPSARELIDLMTEQWKTRDMVHGSITDEKRRDRMIKLLAQAIHDRIKKPT